MCKLFQIAVLVLCLVASAMSASIVLVRTDPALVHDEVHDQFGQFAVQYATANHDTRVERGHLVRTASGAPVLVYDGEYSFFGQDGKKYTVKYRAGLDGFHAEGDHLPKPPKPEPVA